MQKQNPEETTPSPVHDEALPNTEDTQLSQAVNSSEENAETPKKKSSRIWLRAIGLGTLAFIMILGVSLFSGYQTGQGDYEATLEVINAVEAYIQFDLAQQDFNEGRFEIAKTRLEWISAYDSEYPGLLELLVAIDVARNQDSSPTDDSVVALASPTPSITATPDGRGADEIYADILAYKDVENWDLLLETLNGLRANYPEYKPIEVDNLYYFAFRTRGASRILLEGNLESGIFDLSQAERFGKLDVEAQSYRKWAEWYITGMSYWEVNWGESVFYFEQVSYSAPNLYDSDFFTATNRLATAQVGHAQDLIARSEYLLTVKGWCAADRNYKLAFSYIGIDPVIQPTAEWATLKCELNPDEGPNE